MYFGCVCFIIPSQDGALSHGCHWATAGAACTVALPINSIASLLVEANGCLVMYLLAKELEVAFYEVMHTTVTRGVNKGAKVYE